MMEYIAQARVPTCLDPDCGSLVKPDIVFFGESVSAPFSSVALQSLVMRAKRKRVTPTCTSPVKYTILLPIRS